MLAIINWREKYNAIANEADYFHIIHKNGLIYRSARSQRETYVLAVHNQFLTFFPLLGGAARKHSLEHSVTKIETRRRASTSSSEQLRLLAVAKQLLLLSSSWCPLLAHWPSEKNNSKVCPACRRKKEQRCRSANSPRPLTPKARNSPQDLEGNIALNIRSAFMQCWVPELVFTCWVQLPQ